MNGASVGNTSGWKAIWQRLSPFVKHKIYTPSILLVMIRTLEYTGVSYKGSRLKYADMYIYPEMLKFKRSDFHRAWEAAVRALGGVPRMRRTRPDEVPATTRRTRPWW